MFKEGDVIVCINSYSDDLLIGHKYTIDKPVYDGNNMGYFRIFYPIKNTPYTVDENVMKKYFIPLIEYRRNKIKKILEKTRLSMC